MISTVGVDFGSSGMKSSVRYNDQSHDQEFNKPLQRLRLASTTLGYSTPSGSGPGIFQGFGGVGGFEGESLGTLGSRSHEDNKNVIEQYVPCFRQ